MSETTQPKSWDRQHRRDFDITKTPEVRRVQSLRELNSEGASLEGLYRGLAGDALQIPGLLGSYFAAKLRDLIGIDDIEFGEHHEILLIPGYAATSRHLGVVHEYLRDLAITSHLFDRRSLTARVLDDAKRTADQIAKTEHQICIAGHSRGGLVALCTLKMLQDQGISNRVKAAVLLSPVSHGIRDEIAPIAQLLGIPAISDLCPDSEAVRFWQGLDQASRSNVKVVSQIHGDAFTSPDRSHVEGGETYLVPHCSHQAAVRDQDTIFFQVATRLLEDSVIRPN